MPLWLSYPRNPFAKRYDRTQSRYEGNVYCWHDDLTEDSVIEIPFECDGCGWWPAVAAFFRDDFLATHMWMAEHTWACCALQAQNDPPGPWWGLSGEQEIMIEIDEFQARRAGSNRLHSGCSR